MSTKRRWVGRIYLGRDENGKQQFEWVGRFNTRRQRDLAVAARRMELQAAKGPRLPTCDEYVDRYLAEYAQTHKDSSLATQTERLKRFKRDFKGKPLDVDRQTAKEWAASVPANCVAPVVTLYNHAIDEDDLPLARNPFRKLAGRTKGRSELAPPTDEEFERLLDACRVLGSYAPMMRALIRFAAFSLMRPGELYALEWADIDFEQMRIRKARRVFRGKTDVPKTGVKLIALTPPARDAILGLPRTGPLVFTSKTGRRLSQSGMSGYWDSVLAAAGLDMPFYLCTKHFGVHYMWTKLEMSNRAIAAQAGWSVQAVDKLLAVYGHFEVGALDEVDAAFRRADVVPLRPRVVGE